MSPRSAILFRYRFRTPAQLGRHLHVAEGRTLLFYRSPRVELRSGDPVVLEICFDATEARLLLRGLVLSLSGGTTSGAWLEFPDTRLVGEKLEGIALAPRKQRRLGCEAMVQIVQNDNRAIGKMVDVSMGGARILGATAIRVGAMPLRAGSAVGLRIVGAEPPFPSDLGRADVVRVDLNTGELAVRWVRSDPVVRIASMKLIDAARRSWAQAQEMVHAPPCCRNGHVLDPPMPTMKRRL